MYEALANTRCQKVEFVHPFVQKPKGSFCDLICGCSEHKKHNLIMVSSKELNLDTGPVQSMAGPTRIWSVVPYIRGEGEGNKEEGEKERRRRKKWWK